MFDIGWTELLVIAVVAIIVVGPKDLPRMLRAFGQTVGKMRRMANEFQSTFNEALREAEKQADIADMRKQVEAAANFDPLGDLKKSIELKPDKAPKAEATTPEPAAPTKAEPAAEKADQVEGNAETTAAPAKQDDTQEAGPQTASQGSKA